MKNPNKLVILLSSLFILYGCTPTQNKNGDEIVNYEMHIAFTGPLKSINELKSKYSQILENVNVNGCNDLDYVSPIVTLYRGDLKEKNYAKTVINPKQGNLKTNPKQDSILYFRDLEKFVLPTEFTSKDNNENDRDFEKDAVELLYENIGVDLIFYISENRDLESDKIIINVPDINALEDTIDYYLCSGKRNFGIIIHNGKDNNTNLSGVTVIEKTPAESNSKPIIKKNSSPKAAIVKVETETLQPCQPLQSRPALYLNKDGELYIDNNPDYKYIALFSEYPVFATNNILTSIQLPQNLLTYKLNTKELKSVIKYSQLFIQFQIYCNGSLIGNSQTFGPCRITCAAVGDCQIERN